MNPIVSIDTTKKIPVYTVRKIHSDKETDGFKGKFLEASDFKVILTTSADVYTEDGELLLRFRKGAIDQSTTDDAYTALKDFITHKTTDRGIASGSEKGLATGQKNPVMSNILGYFDKWGISQRATFKRSGIKAPSKCRLATFNVHFPEKWKKVLPLIREVDRNYAQLCPKEQADQLRAAKRTSYHIAGTSFSTVTTNLNFRTAAHTDSGDWPTGFGNLIVIEKGTPYKGAFTGFPQYGVAVDCRTGDFLAMDVHQVHGNCPMIPGDETSKRLSLVCYLRENIVKRCAGEPMYNAQALEKRLQNWRATQKKSRQTRRARRDDWFH